MSFAFNDDDGCGTTTQPQPSPRPSMHAVLGVHFRLHTKCVRLISEFTIRFFLKISRSISSSMDLFSVRSRQFASKTTNNDDDHKSNALHGNFDNFLHALARSSPVVSRQSHHRSLANRLVLVLVKAFRAILCCWEIYGCIQASRRRVFHDFSGWYTSVCAKTKSHIERP